MNDEFRQLLCNARDKIYENIDYNEYLIDQLDVIQSSLGMNAKRLKARNVEFVNLIDEINVLIMSE